MLRTKGQKTKQYDMRLNSRISVTLAALIAATGLGIATQTSAQSVSEGKNASSLMEIIDVSGPQRIDHSGRLRMLSQRLSAAACVLSTSPDSKFVRQSLIKARDEFGRTLVALRNGDDGYGITGVELDRRVLSALDKVAEEWVPFEIAIDDILAGVNVKSNLEFLAVHNMDVLESSGVLVSEISNEYSHPAEMTASGAILIDMSGRQRTILQKIAKQYCGVVHGVDALGTQDELDATLVMFDAVLAALRNGDPSTGVKPPPNAEIRQKLQVFDDEWHKVEAILDKDAHSSEAHYKLQVELFEALTGEVKELSEITRLYAIAARIVK